MKSAPSKTLRIKRAIALSTCFLSMLLAFEIITCGGCIHIIGFCTKEKQTSPTLPGEIDIVCNIYVREKNFSELVIPGLYARSKAVAPFGLDITFISNTQDQIESVSLGEVVIEYADKNTHIEFIPVFRSQTMEYFQEAVKPKKTSPYYRFTVFFIDTERIPENVKVNGFYKNKDYEEISFEYTFNVTSRSETSLITGWYYFFDSYTPPTWSPLSPMF